MECHVGSKGIATQTAGSHRQDSGSGLKSKEEQGRGTDYSLDYISAREVFPSPPVTVSSFSTARYTQGSRAMESSTESFVLVHPPASAAAAAAPPFVLPRAEVRTAILQHRLVQPDRSLAIDHLLALAAENLVQLYPPASESDLESLVAHLDALAAPDQAAPLVAKSCLYYLALALNADQDEEEAAEAHNYAENELLLPLPFRLAVRALVALDAGQHHLAVRWLAHPAVTPDFVPRTIAVLATVPEPAEDRAALVLDYYRLARLDLELYSVREAQYIVEALCAPERKRGVAQAWNLARDWPREHERPQLWTAILETCFGSKGYFVTRELSPGLN